MEKLNCTLCEKEALTKKETIKHVFKDHLNYVPWKCSECDFEAYAISDKYIHENETTHTMAEAEKYASNFRIFSIIYCDMRYVSKFGEENLDKCRIIRPSADMNIDNIICNKNTLNMNIQNLKTCNDGIEKIEIDNTKKSKPILESQNITQENEKVIEDTSNKHLSINNGQISEDSKNTSSKNEKAVYRHSIGNSSLSSNISFQEINSEIRRGNKESSENIKKKDNDDIKKLCRTNEIEPLENLTKRRGIRERITYEKDSIDDGGYVDSYERPSKRLRCSYNVLKPTLSSNKYVLEYAFILDGDEISKLLYTSNVKYCKICGREVRNEYDVLHHIQHYHNPIQEYKSPMLSCGFKRCGLGFDDMNELKKHAKDHHNISTFVNNIDACEKRREKNVYVNISANGLLKYEQLFIDCFPNLILRYCGEPLEKNEGVQLFISYSSEKSDYLNSEYFFKKTKGKDHIYCSICKKKVPVEKYLIRHVIENHMNRKDQNYNILACQECKEPKYYDMDDLEKHWQRKHNDIGPFFNNYHIKFDKSPMQYTCVASIMSKDDLKAYEVVFEQAYPELKIEL